MNRSDRRGFTLIELLIVMGVIIILAGIAIPKLTVARDKAYRSAVTADVRNVADAQEIYLASHSVYAASLDQLSLVGAWSRRAGSR